MKLDEKKIIDYLKNHVGENTTTYMLAKDSGALEGEFDGMETDASIRKIAESNGFRLNSDHHYNELLGMPYSIDFYIEEYNKDAVISAVRNERSLTKRILMIQKEYGIYDNETGELMEMRCDFPDELKEIYEEDTRKLDELQSQGLDVD